MKTQIKKEEVKQQLFNPQVANQCLENILNEDGSLKDNSSVTFNMPYHDWHQLHANITNYLKMPLFIQYSTKWLSTIDDATYPVIYDSNMSWVIKVNQYFQIFRKDLVMDAIVSSLGTKASRFPQFMNWNPFGGAEFYFEIKDAWYKGDLTQSMILDKLKLYVSEAQSKIIKDPQLPFRKGVNPNEITIHIIDLAKMQFQHKGTLINCELETQVGLHGTDMFWNKKQNKPNKNWDILMDLGTNPRLEFDRGYANHQDFPTGFSQKNKDASSKAINKLKKALNNIFVLADGCEWFTKSGDVYKPNFNYDNSLMRTILNTSHIAQKENEYSAYDDRDDSDWAQYEDTNNGLFNNENEIKDNNIY